MPQTVLFVLLCMFILVLGMYCIYKLKEISSDFEAEEENAYSQDELLEVFYRERLLFEDICRIVYGNPDFWRTWNEGGPQSEACLFPDETDRLLSFSEEEQSAIRYFFCKTKPRMICLRERKWIEITYASAERHGDIALVYYFCDDKEKYRLITDARQEGSYSGYERLDDNWTIYTAYTKEAV